MTPHRPVKMVRRRGRIVGVISSCADLRRALRIRNPPDLFELRLDHLVNILDEVQNKLSILRAPLVITARSPGEGGANGLSNSQRRDLLIRFLFAASYVDIELQSADALRSVLDLARQKNVGRIISFHDFNSTPDLRTLRAKARRAQALGADVFKVATRTDTAAQLARLLEFISHPNVDLPLSVMGVGKIGLTARIAFMRHGSVLNYARLGRSSVPGQPSLNGIRAAGIER